MSIINVDKLLQTVANAANATAPDGSEKSARTPANVANWRTEAPKNEVGTPANVANWRTDGSAAPEISQLARVGEQNIDPRHEAFGTLADRIEAFEERAGILESGGGMDRRSAESEALRLLDLLALRGRWTPDDISDGHEAVARNADDAAGLFREMLGRLPDPDPDSRTRCLDCRHYRQSRCARHRQAGLFSPVVGPDLAALPQTCPAFEHGPGPQLVRQPDRPHPAPAEHLRLGWAAFEKCLRWIEPYRQTLAAHGWTDDEVLRLPTNRAGTDAGLAWTLAGFDLDRLEVSASAVVAITRSGSRMTAAKQPTQHRSKE